MTYEKRGAGGLTKFLENTYQRSIQCYYKVIKNKFGLRVIFLLFPLGSFLKHFIPGKGRKKGGGFS